MEDKWKGRHRAAVEVTVSASLGKIGEVKAPTPTDAVDPSTVENLGLQFRAAMRNLASGVSVVTAGVGAQASGFTATSVISLSVEPPTLLVSVNQASATWPLIGADGRFTVNMLAPEHREIAETFAGRRGFSGRDRYNDLRWHRASGQVPYFTDALCVLECELEEALPRHSHVLLIGHVVKVMDAGNRSPLVYWRGQYRDICVQGD